MPANLGAIVSNRRAELFPTKARTLLWVVMMQSSRYPDHRRQLHPLRGDSASARSFDPPARMKPFNGPLSNVLVAVPLRFGWRFNLGNGRISFASVDAVLSLDPSAYCCPRHILRVWCFLTRRHVACCYGLTAHARDVVL